ncbi:hypothetical protein SLEP1_g29189 [Rubroshorea leprosula]|uniref:Uncharacterized protein n=1 Tax=Rubroshorea leprosula TaxID=152421 RepID=A0AAV5JW34_9ROSI|nr:hypothetical protein SLEP1_g29189 [Rubroshorea leprosula]
MAATNPALLGSDETQQAGFGETQPNLGFVKPRSGWVPSNPAWLGFPEPSLSWFPRTQQGWVPTNPAGSRRTQPCWVYPNPAIGFDETPAGFR